LALRVQALRLPGMPLVPGEPLFQPRRSGEHQGPQPEAARWMVTDPRSAKHDEQMGFRDWLKLGLIMSLLPSLALGAYVYDISTEPEVVYKYRDCEKMLIQSWHNRTGVSVFVTSCADDPGNLTALYDLLNATRQV